MDYELIADIETWNSGGSQVLDMVTLKDGRVLVISEDAVVLYSDREDFDSGNAKERPTILL